jgi:hypothetical protein
MRIDLNDGTFIETDPPIFIESGIMFRDKSSVISGRVVDAAREAKRLKELVDGYLSMII